ncbi:MAG: HPr family phosphocarrier protein [Sphingomonadales bacterium]|uniref:HPr family phosphocarrier protein n=1 Tax=Novosphingobium sp. AAP93 TaxID=1523427 RepID=UPI0006B9599E|nr:HPr family phosphocarrier protein [Novosphingobium sp. AAP93]KPF89926.1 serine kinase [Novosphingobium sp. AAP93]MBU6395517.1 HPr family phosphocarrier protein [Sphingomonadales bacterium]MBY0391945.1 HPr family phosphocarrier protein [Novosphingobium sp.]
MTDNAADTSVSTARETVLIINQRGLHARASAKFVNMVARLPEGVDVKVIKDGTEAQGGSILGLMMLGAAKGDTVEIVVTGTDAEAVLMKVAGLVKDGFGED